MRRADKRTPEQIAIQRYNYLLDLPDRELCREDHSTSALPEASRGACAWTYIAGELDGHVLIVECPLPGEWGLFVRGRGVRRGCTWCVAKAIRARLWLQRQRLIREHGPFAASAGGTGRPDRSTLRQREEE